MRRFSLWTGVSLLLLICQCGFAQSDVLTQHNDLNRTGWNSHETILNTSNVNNNSFGLVAVRPVDDPVYAQPLVVNGVSIGGGTHNIVILATTNNTIYAYDADDTTTGASPYWVRNFTPTNCRTPWSRDIHPSLCFYQYKDFPVTFLRIQDTVARMGIVGTPVIDKTTNTLYVVTRYVDPVHFTIDEGPHLRFDCASGQNLDTDTAYSNAGFFQVLHAIDIRTGNEIKNVTITATANGTGFGNVGGVISFDPRRNNQRGGLALANGIVYIPYAAHCDMDNSHGWLIGYDASSLMQKIAYITTPNDGRGGIWMSGAAPAVDVNGNIYLATGNGRVGASQEACAPGGGPNPDKPFDSLHTPTIPINRGISVVKLTPNAAKTALNVSSFFTPQGFDRFNDADYDFAVQTMLIPNTNLLVAGNKNTNLYVMDTAKLGGYNLNLDNVLQVIPVGAGAQMHSSFAYYGGSTPYFYQFAESTTLQAFPISGGRLGSAIVSGIGGIPQGNSGAYMATTSNGTDSTTAILWINEAYGNCNANFALCQGDLRAVKATDVNTEIWNSNTNWQDNYGLFSKMNTPTVANGKVYVPTISDQYAVFGQKPFNPCGTNVAAGKTAHAMDFTDQNNVPANAFDGNINTKWTSLSNDNDWIYVDLGSLYNICTIAIYWEAGLGKAFAIDISSDTTKGWTQVDTFTNNTSLTTIVNNVNKQARYVRMQGGARGTPFGYSIWEMQVFGTPANLCTAPILKTPNPLDPNDEKVSWHTSAGALTYNIRYQPPMNVDWLNRTGTDTSLTLSALSCNNTNYTYQVQAVCASGPSIWSSGSFITPACTTSCPGLPVRHFHTDIGDIGIAGNSCLLAAPSPTESVIQVSGSGNGIAGGSDQYQFMFINFSGAEQITARIDSQSNSTNPFNKAGLMFRDSITMDSRFIFIGLNSGNGMIMVYRTTAGGPTDSVNVSGPTAPYWIQLSKTGNQYKAFISPNGKAGSWVQVGPTLTLGFGSGTSLINAGLAVSSSSNSILSTTTFDFFEPTAPLPITLTSFTAKNVNNQFVYLQWATSMETNTDHFEVQRSTDGINFATIATVQAAGYSDVPKYYTVQDQNPAMGINYYRLKEVDMDGKFMVSKVLIVNFGVQAEPVIYPNPTTSFFNIVAGAETIQDVAVYSPTGRIIERIENSGGVTSLKVSLANEASGVYIIQIKTPTQVYYQKVLKQ